MRLLTKDRNQGKTLSRTTPGDSARHMREESGTGAVTAECSAQCKVTATFSSQARSAQ
ncbi:hypothetical protein SAMN05216299_10122 [Nitrosospira sp. Nsp14]|nr:hypothetical protein SAMN05216299_10122 [Nitrosospira sp. Nsp14]